MSRIGVLRRAAALAAVTNMHGTASAAAADIGLAWAVNVGGPAYTAVDGTRFVAEESVSGGRPGEMGAVKGSQDPELYRTYREGDIRIAHPLPNGNYDVTFHFAEPADIRRGERIFGVVIEDRPALEDIDVMLFRDSQVRSALTMTVPGITIKDGSLDIRFDASMRDPLLSALVVRSRGQPQGNMRLVWSDEFDEEGSPSPANWNVEAWAAGTVNNEDQAYTARLSNVRVEGGRLVIEAHKEDYRGDRYTSARIQSKGKRDLLYGRVEIRAKLPRGVGTWPAIWMLPSDPYVYATNCAEGDGWHGNPNCDAWPNSGEIDIVEHVGYQMNHVHATVHNSAYYWLQWEQRKGRIVLDDVSDSFHLYALEWTPHRIDAYVDGALYFTYVNQGEGWRAWPYDRPYHLILNLAVGGDWGRAGGDIDDSIFPQRLLVDYVRVYAMDGAASSR